MVSDCGCINATDYSAVYNQRMDWLKRMNSTGTGTTTPTYGYDPGLSFGGSIFDFDNSTFANTYGGLGMGALGSYGFGTGGYSMPYGGMYGNGQGYWDWMFNNMSNGNAYNLQNIQLGRENESKINTPSEAIQGTLSVLQDKIRHNDQKGIIPAYNKLCDAISLMWPNLSKNEVRIRAKAIYAEYAKKPLYEDIRDNGTGIFMRKFWNGLTFGKLAKGSAEENIEQLTGLPMSEENRIYGKLGKGAGAATATAIVGTAGLIGLRNIKSIAGLMSKGIWGWAIAGASLLIGGIAAFGSGNKKAEKE